MTIRRRLVLMSVAAFVVVLVASGMVALGLLRNRLINDVDASLTERQVGLEQLLQLVPIDQLEPGRAYDLTIEPDGATSPEADEFLPRLFETQPPPSGNPVATFATHHQLHYRQPRCFHSRQPKQLSRRRSQEQCRWMGRQLEQWCCRSHTQQQWRLPAHGSC